MTVEPDVEITADTTVVGHALTAALQASTPQAAAPQATAPTGAQPAAPETASPSAAQPTTPEAGGTATSTLLWLGLIAFLIVVAVIVVRSLK